MGKVEIKIRKKILTPDNLQQYRDYPALLKKYERNKRFKRALRIFIYSLALTLFVLALIFLGMWKVLMDKKEENKSKSEIYTYALIHRPFLNPDPGGIDTLIRRNVNTVVNDTFYVVSYQDEKNTIVIKLPIKLKNNSKSIHWLDEKTVKTDQGNSRVIKYRYDEEIVDDEEALYFYSPEYGMILERSIVWGSYIRLMRIGNSELDQRILELTQAIQADTVFFTEWKP